jgi:uncharacterized YigZ family protein
MEEGRYKSISGESEGNFKDKGSKFLALAFPVENEQEISEIRDKIRKKYHDARHHAYAFRLGADMKTFRASDDGEPANSSGQPILNKIKSHELSDILIIVVRYFGGIKLGIPGLIRAYGTAAEEAIIQAEIVIKTVTKKITIHFDYAQMNEVMRVINDFHAIVISRDFTSDCFITIEIPESEHARLLGVIQLNHKLMVN